MLKYCRLTFVDIEKLSVFQHNQIFFISVPDLYCINISITRDAQGFKVVSSKSSGELIGSPCNLKYVPSSHQKKLQQ